MSLLLQHKILVGYFLLMAIIGSMAATLLHERNRVIGIESEMKHIHRVQHDVNTAHRYITLLAMRGETAIAWEKEDFEDYRSLRLRVDTMLQTMQSGSEEFVSRAQMIDTLRHLLANKEEHLHQIRDPQEKGCRRIFRRERDGACNAFRLCHTPSIEQGTTIHAGRTAGSH